MKNRITEKHLKIAIALTSFYFIVEVIGGFLSGSLSLLGDAGHMLRDVFSLLITLGAMRIAKRLPTKTKTFGYHRVEILAAFINGLLLVGISVWIFLESIDRFTNPIPIKSPLMFSVAFIGLIVNLYVALKLHGSDDLNIKAAFLHVLTDALASFGVIFAAIWIFFTGQTIIDPILSVVIAFFILSTAFTVIRDALNILLEFTPKNINIDNLIKTIEKIEGVGGIHDIHLWSLCSSLNVMDAHIFTDISDMNKIEKLKTKIKRELEKFNIKHSTLEFECEECTRKNKIEKIEH
ncbi:MAG: cation diffusion facilitator family transporter [candidate division WOR-3 bacterium]|jgi:cobalt-zinc-cadmium efflux system protein